VKSKALKYLNFAIVLALFMLPFSPEISVIAFILGMLIKLDTKIIINKFQLLSLIISILFINLSSLNFILLQLPFLMICFFTKSESYRKYGKILILSQFIFVVVLFVALLRVKNFQWEDNDSTKIENSYLTKITPSDSKNSLSTTNIGYLSPGSVDYILKLRSSKEYRLRVSFWLPKTRESHTIFCDLDTIFSICKISMNLKTNSFVMIVLGEGDSWVKNDPYIEVQSTRLYVNLKEQLFTWSLPLQRWRGFSFNENAFGAQMAVVGLLATIIAPTYFWMIIAPIPAIYCIFLSGSRGALVAFLIGLVVFFLFRTRYYKLLPLILLFFMFGFFILQIGVLKENPEMTPEVNQIRVKLRSLDFINQDLNQIRLEIWRLALSAWLENPRTFLIGTGDINAAMKKYVDVHSKKFGLTEDSLTHTHNLWLQTVGTTGIIGLIFMLWLWSWVFRRAWRTQDAGAMALLITIFVINSVDYLFFYAPIHLCFWIAAIGFSTENSTTLYKTKINLA
jgi:hypothetical protein